MTRVLSYNILAGGQSIHAGRSQRTEQLAQMIEAAQPDIVGLVEAINPLISRCPEVIEELAERLGMQLIRGDHPSFKHEFQVALLTRRPVAHWQLHVHPRVLTRPVLEVCVEEEHGQPLTVFVAHLVASFHNGWAGDHLRQYEVRKILYLMARRQGKPHLLMGDLNALAPGDRLQASALVRYLVELEHLPPVFDPASGHPNLSHVIPERLHFLKPLVRVIPHSRPLMRLLDEIASLYAPRGSIALLRKAGYVDCFRHLHPGDEGFTCPAGAPAGRIDFVFASPELAPRLEACSVVSHGANVHGAEASDHLPVVAGFASSVLMNEKVLPADIRRTKVLN